MALIKNEVLYLPIGCSCINQFQLDFSFSQYGTQDSHLFDWCITTPDATANIFNKKMPFLTSLSDIEVFHPNRVRSVKEPGYLWWHLEKIMPRSLFPIETPEDLAPGFDELVSRHQHHVRKMFEEEYSNVCCIWSNIQPNLKKAVEDVGFSYDPFFLSEERYNALNTAVSNLNWNNSRVVFVTRIEDCESSLLDKDNIILLELERSEEYKGQIGLYDPVWEYLGLK